jgi:hypothetical protein
VIRHNLNNGNVIFLHSLYKTSGITRKAQFANADFNSQFSCGNYAQIDTINTLADNLASILGQQGIARKKPNSSVSVKQIAVHLHIALEVIKRRVKIICHPVITFYTTKFALFFLFRNRLLASRSRKRAYFNPPRRNFGRNINGQLMVDGYFYSLRNAHGVNIA